MTPYLLHNAFGSVNEDEKRPSNRGTHAVAGSLARGVERALIPEERLANAVLSCAITDAKKIEKGQALDRGMASRGAHRLNASLKYESRLLLNWLCNEKDKQGSLYFWCDIAGVDAASFQKAMLARYGAMLRAKARG